MDTGRRRFWSVPTARCTVQGFEFQVVMQCSAPVLQQFLAHTGIADQDVEIYLESILASSDADANDIDELLCGYSATWASAWRPAVRQQKIKQLLHQIAMRGAQTGPGNEAMPPQSAAASAQQAACDPANSAENVHSKGSSPAQPALATSSASAAACMPTPRLQNSAAIPAGLFPTEKGGIEGMLTVFLARHGGAQLQDEAVLNYLQALLEDWMGDDDAAPDVEQLDDVLSGFAPDSWATAPEAERHMRLCDLMSDIRKLQQQQQPQTQSASLQRPPKPASNGAASRRQPAVAAEPVAASQQDQTPSADPAQLAMLSELCGGGLSDQFLEQVLMQTCRTDVEAAAQWLIECEDVQQQEAAWRKARKKAKAAALEEAERQKRERQRILQSFDLQAVSNDSGGSGSRSRKGLPSLDPWAPANSSKSGKIRYRDGAQVTSKGEKFILLAKPGDDYDGGSRGTVKTKGKRGTGFV